MKEKEFKKIMTQSEVSTSESFTDDLLHKLVSQPVKNPVKIDLRKVLLILTFLSLMLFALAATISLPYKSLVDVSTAVSRVPLMAGVLFLLLAGLNHILRLARKVDYYNGVAKQ
jgi:hypothetical protein